MRISLVYPGPMFSVRDVARGYHRALALLGHEVRMVDLPKRVDFFSEAIRHVMPRVTNDDEALRLAAEMAVAETVRQRADLVLVVSAMYLHPDCYELWRRIGVPTATIFTECPYADDNQVRLAALTDHAFVNDLASVPRFRAANPRTWYLPAAYDPEVHRPVRIREQTCDVLFVGTGFRDRIALLESVDWDGIDLRLWGAFDWPDPERAPLKRWHRDLGIPNEQVPRFYAGAKVNLNPHRQVRDWGADGGTVRDAYSANPRTYELAACEAFQLCSADRPEVPAVFGDAVPRYRNAADLGCLIREYLPRPDDRRDRALAARERVAPHTFMARAETLLHCVA